MARYTIPPQLRSGFELLIGLTSENVKVLSDILGSSKVGESVAEIVERNKSNFQLIESDFGNIIASLFSLVNIFRESQGLDTKVETFVEDFVLSYQRVAKNTTSDDIHTLQNHLLQLIPSLGVSVRHTIKARDLLTENLNNFSDARVISDIRIVYDEDKELQNINQYALVVHHLKIEFFQE